VTNGRQRTQKLAVGCENKHWLFIPDPLLLELVQISGDTFLVPVLHRSIIKLIKRSMLLDCTVQ